MKESPFLQFERTPLVSPEVVTTTTFPSPEELFSLDQMQESINNGLKTTMSNLLSFDQLAVMWKQVAQEMVAIENAGRNPDRWNFSEEQAKQMKLIVDLSAPGNYYHPTKNDRYNTPEKLPYAWNMDRFRADQTAILGIQLAGIQAGNDFQRFREATILTGLDKNLIGLRSDAKAAIAQTDLRFLYIGRQDEGHAIRTALARESSFIPESHVDIIDGPEIDNTLDQVHALHTYLASSLESGELTQGDTITFVLGPQAMRFFRMTNRYEGLPEGLDIAVFPVATPDAGLRQYYIDEACALANYTIAGKASLEPSNYHVLGSKH